VIKNYGIIMNILSRSSLNLQSKKRCRCFSQEQLQSNTRGFKQRYSMCFVMENPFSRWTNSGFPLYVASEFKRPVFYENDNKN